MDESQIPQPILDRLSDLLSGDGFRQTLPGLFVKYLDEEWRAWIGIDGNPYQLMPTVGVYSEEVRKIAASARAKLGRPPQPVDVGPPLIIQNFETVMSGDPECVKRNSWTYSPGSDGLGVRLNPGTADDLAYCLKAMAYPFFRTYASYQGIFDAALKDMASYAFSNYFPVVLVKLGRRDYATSYMDAQVRGAKTDELAQRYRQYADALMEVLPA